MGVAFLVPLTNSCDEFELSGLGKLAVGKIVLALLSVFITLAAVQAALAANTPCSGRKGGISHCQGATFICNDGSVSASKKSCAAVFGGGNGAVGFMSSGASEMAPANAQTECSCRSGLYCTGPRGGQYCLTDTGRKSYLRK